LALAAYYARLVAHVLAIKLTAIGKRNVAHCPRVRDRSALTTAAVQTTMLEPPYNTSH